MNAISESGLSLEDVEFDKEELADWFGVGVRTVENWLTSGILAARVEKHRRIFNLAECEQRLLSYDPKKKNRK